MSNIRKEDIKQEVFDLYDDYAHNRLDRREFVQKLSVYAVGALTVPALMSFLMPDYQNNIQIKADDPRLKSEYIKYDSPKGGGSIKGLLKYNESRQLPAYQIVTVWLRIKFIEIFCKTE